MRTLKDFGIKTVINAIALWVAALAVSGIRFNQQATANVSPDSWQVVRTVLLVALVFGLVNTIVRPVVKLFSWPAIILTLGLFIFVLNAMMLQLTSWLAGKLDLAFHVDHFLWDAVLGSLIITFVSMILNLFNPADKDDD